MYIPLLFCKYFASIYFYISYYFFQPKEMYSSPSDMQFSPSLNIVVLILLKLLRYNLGRG